jgi:putative protease
MQRTIEIMAPVGSHESLTAAIEAGCNSVYFGLEQLNMRSRSSINFTSEDLPNIVTKCNINNVKSYLTLNTVLYDHDIRLMKDLIENAKEAGVSAVIASDHAAMSYCKKIGMPVHISTQVNVTNIDTLEFYAEYADVMVLSRELTLKQVADITREIKRRNITGPSGDLIKIEVFAHGALCMAVSGKCYLSLHSHNASANRGACIQNCRRKYVVTDKDEGIEFEIDNEYIMSAKDLCTIGFLDKIIDSGVEILKIEGRGRSADYVDTTVRCYREALEAIENNTYTEEKVSDWTKQLETVYNRGFWDGYYLGRKMGEWNNSYGSKATTKKLFLGRGVKYFNKIKVGEFSMESHNLKQGDKILITGPTTGIIRTTVKELRLNNVEVNVVKKGDSFSLPIDHVIRPSDKLYKVVENV